MALDEAISEAVRKELSPPTLRLYQWVEPSVSIGYFQKISDINTEYCRKKCYPFVRRSTGGTAILHDSELTYSFSARTDLEPFKGGLLRNYMVISSALVLALKLISLDAQITLSKNKRQRSPFCFKTSSYGEIAVNGQKVIGSAQRRYNNGFLQQGSMLMNSDAEELSKVLKQYNLKEDFCEIGTIKKYASAVSIADLKTALKKAFEKIFRIRFSSDGLTEFELNLTEKLEAKKYSTKEWNFRR